MSDKATAKSFVCAVQKGRHWPHVITEHFKCVWLELVSVKYKAYSENSGHKKDVKYSISNFYINYILK